MLEMITWPVS